MPHEVQQLAAETIASDVAEALSLLYVAVTRAVRALHMIISPSTAAKDSLKKSYAGLLRAALTDHSRLEPLTVPFQHGNENWYAESIEPKEAVKEKTSTPIAIRFPIISFQPTDRKRKRGLEHTSPSAAEGGQHLRIDHVLHNGTMAMQRGTLIHLFFEQLEWTDESLPTVEQLCQLASTQTELSLAREQIEHEAIQFVDRLQSDSVYAVLRHSTYLAADAKWLKPTIVKVLRQGSYELSVHNEFTFAVRSASKLVTGSIDRLVVARRAGKPIAADIIDFKTDAVSETASIDQRTDHYRPQIAEYRKAVQQFLSLDETVISGRLLFVEAGKLVDATD